MGNFSKWILALVCATIVGFIVELLFAETKLNRFMRFIMASVTLLIVVTPLPSLLNGLGFSIPQFSYSQISDSSYMQFILDKRIELLENYCVSAIKNVGIDGASVKISAKYNEQNEVEISLVEINLSSVVISGNDMNINKQEVAINAVHGYLKIERDRIIVYE